MLNTLRNRLLASYLALIVITLGSIGLALLVFLRTRPLPTNEIVRDLTATLLDVRVAESIRVNTNINPETWTSPQTNPLPMPTIELRIATYLDNQAETRDVRTLVVNGRGEVRFDSAGVFEEGDRIAQIERRPLIPPGTPRALVSEISEGRFSDPDGEEWIFVAQPVLPILSMWNQQATNEQRQHTQSTQPTANQFVMVAQPMPRPTLREVFRLFGNTFFEPLLRAGILGLGIAVVLSMLIARSVARPLQRISQATHQIAHGDFSQRVPVKGPKEVRTMAASFNGMVSRVAHTQQAQRDFLANVSHDLRTPLTSIQGFSQAIVDGVAAEPDSARHAAQVIHDEAARLHRMVEELLDMARIEAGQFDMLRHAVEIDAVLRAVGESLAIKARAQNVQLDIALPDHLPRIAGDGDRLAQVFTNLLDNAIKHTPEGGTVQLGAAADEHGIIVTVRDTGAGIPPEDLPRIFERFYQVDKSRQRSPRSGVGLGLAITRQIVEAHGGQLHVKSEVGNGTTFTVWLPHTAPELSTATSLRRSG